MLRRLLVIGSKVDDLALAILFSALDVIADNMGNTRNAKACWVPALPTKKEVLGSPTVIAPEISES